jgi:hypothetical protein
MNTPLDDVLDAAAKKVHDRDQTDELASLVTKYLRQHHVSRPNLVEQAAGYLGVKPVTIRTHLSYLAKYGLLTGTTGTGLRKPAEFLNRSSVLFELMGVGRDDPIIVLSKALYPAFEYPPHLKRAEHPVVSKRSSSVEKPSPSSTITDLQNRVVSLENFLRSLGYDPNDVDSVYDGNVYERVGEQK